MLYTDPEIAHVGLSQAEAAAGGVAIRTFMQEMGAVDRAVLDGETAGMAKIHVREGSDQIVGATIVAAHAGETISEIDARDRRRESDLVESPASFIPIPRRPRSIKKIADAYNRTRLTPSRKRVLERLLVWRRQ